MINMKLAKARGLSDLTIHKISSLQNEADIIVGLMRDVVNSEQTPIDYDKLRSLRDEWTKVQLMLQESWGFEKNENFHRSYMLPGCTCPKMDNDDRLGTPYHIFNTECPLHQITGKK